LVTVHGPTLRRDLPADHDVVDVAVAKEGARKHAIMLVGELAGAAASVGRWPARAV
jgi:hypothetical protein